MTFNHFSTLLVAFLLISLSVHAVEKDTAKTLSTANLSDGKWLIAPKVSNSPKLGFSGGASANYINNYDDLSPVSIAGASATYSDTDSWVGLLYNRSFWDNNTQRALMAGMISEAKNDYDDYLGQGPASIDTTLELYYGRYQQRLGNSFWFIGGSYVYTNMDPQAANKATDIIISEFDIGEVYSGGLGLNITYDSRNSVMNPTSGSYLEFSVTKFDKAFASDFEYWSYNTQYSYFQVFNENFILAYNASLLSTADAPKTSQATLRRLRGYTPGENSAENALVVQIEGRYKLNNKWGVAVFTGVGSLFNDTSKVANQDNLFPMAGIGARYILDQKSQTVLRLDFAVGESGNNGLYLQIGQAF
jgi:hypothetical protein